MNFEIIDTLIEDSVEIGKSIGLFNRKVNVAIDEHDDPYYGMDNPYLINVARNKFRGTDKESMISGQYTTELYHENFFICTDIEG